MSFPNIPDIAPEISIEKEDAIALLLASVAFEELGLAHIINAEAEKLQYALGTLPERRLSAPATLAQVLSVNATVSDTMRNVIKNQMLLTFKLEDVIDYTDVNVYKNTATVTAAYEQLRLFASDVAYYHTIGGVVA